MASFTPLSRRDFLKFGAASGGLLLGMHLPLAARAGAQEVDIAAVQTAAGIVLQPQRARRAAEATLEASGATGSVRADRTEVQVRATVSTRTVFLGLLGIDEV